MPYDAAKDVELENREVDVDGQKFTASLKSYDGGDLKVAISMAGGRFPVKRMTPKQLVSIAKAIEDWVGRAAPAKPAPQG
ncbi:MAG: hypothetical protein AAB152_06855 [Candidatus Coatesbacteria bacterium]